MKYLIGFTNKYYTLWNETLETKVIGEQTYNIHKYTYMQNLSFDKETAFAKAPEGARFDESLRGLSASFEKTEVTVNPNAFHCGKYTSMLFENCGDYDYMMWFFNNCARDNQKENISNILLKEGYGIISMLDNPYMISPEEVALRNELLEMNKLGKEFIKNSEIVILPIRNLNNEGDLYIEEYDLEIHFMNYNVNEYNGYEYGLPLDKKGKAKRIKNKEMKITNFDILEDGWHGRNRIAVFDWEFNK